jgi:tRNA A37 methylthiotransferase MiaB
VLVCGPNRTGDGFEGRTEANEIVHVRSDADLVGSLVNVRIAQSFKHSLEGTPLGPLPPRERRPGRRALPVV